MIAVPHPRTLGWLPTRRQPRTSCWLGRRIELGARRPRPHIGFGEGSVQDHHVNVRPSPAPVSDQLYKIGLAESEHIARALTGKGEGKGEWHGPDSAPDHHCELDAANHLHEVEWLCCEGAVSADQGCREPWEVIHR